MWYSRDRSIGLSHVHIAKTIDQDSVTVLSRSIFNIDFVYE